MIAQALRGPHNLYRRYQALLESTITSVGLAIIVALALESIPVYPHNWIVVMAVAIAALGIRWPLAAYLVAVGVMLYPIYTVNLYLAVPPGSDLLKPVLNNLLQARCKHFLKLARGDVQLIRC